MAFVLMLSSCSEPYAKFEYTLVCSEMLLQYATPTVSYTGVSGNLITKELTAEYWQDGDGQDENNFTLTYQKGADNSAKKHWKCPTIEFDDFSSADSEITVTYTPKEDVSEDSVIYLLGGLFHKLSYKVTVKDDDGDMHQMPNGNVAVIVANQTMTISPSGVTLNNRLNLVDHIKAMKDSYKIHAESNGKIAVN